MSVFPGYKFTSEGFAAIKTVRAKHSQTETRQKKNTWKRLCCDKGEYQHEMSALQTRYLLTCCTIKFLMFVCLIKISPRNNFNILSGDSRWSLPGSMLSSNLDIIRFSIWNVAADDEVWSVVTSLRHMFVWLGPLTVRLRLRGTECDTSAAALSLSLSSQTRATTQGRYWVQVVPQSSLLKHLNQPEPFTALLIYGSGSGSLTLCSDSLN